MKDLTPRLVKYVFFALAVLAGLLIHFVNGNLAALAELVRPGSALAAHLVLLAVEAVALLWFWKGVFGGRRHLLLVEASTPEEERAFAEELTRRMKNNPLIMEAGIVPEGKQDPEYLPRCIAHLNARADEEIQQNARRIFLATALSQNGRLDALIVFVCLCRLILRVSRIYNQRPHPREIASLYAAVATTTFLALSIEELDITTEITVGFGEAFHAMAPAGLTASIPFAGKALQTFTASTIDGAANCYLALRAGIITRNAYAYGACKALRPSRAQVFREAGAQLLDMSHGFVDRIAATLATSLAGVARSAGAKTVQAGKDIVESIGRVGFGMGRPATEADMNTAGGAGETAPCAVALPALEAQRGMNAALFPERYAAPKPPSRLSRGAGATWSVLSRPFRKKGSDGDPAKRMEGLFFPDAAFEGENGSEGNTGKKPHEEKKA